MNPRSITPAALLLATALALAGCAGTSAPSTADGSSPAAAPAASPAASPSSVPPSAASVKVYATDELARIIAGLKDEAGAAFTAVPADQLSQGMATVKQMMETAVISPAECAAVIDSNAQIPEGSTYASGISQPATDQVITVVTVVAVKDPGLQSANLDETVANSKKCSTFTVEIQGQKVSSETEVLDVKTSAEKTVSTMATQTLPSGQTLTTVTVMGLNGALTAGAVASGPGVTAASSGDLARLVDEALAKG